MALPTVGGDDLNGMSACHEAAEFADVLRVMCLQT